MGLLQPIVYDIKILKKWFFHADWEAAMMFKLVLLIIAIIAILIATSIYIAVCSKENIKGVKKAVNKKLDVSGDTHKEEANSEEEEEEEEDLHYTEITGMALPSQATYKTTRLCTLSVMSTDENPLMLVPSYQNVKVVHVEKNYPVPDEMKFKLHMYDLKNYYDSGEYVTIEAVEKRATKWGMAEMFVCNITADENHHSKIELQAGRPYNETWEKYKLATETVSTDDRFFQIVKTDPKKNPHHLSFFHLNTDTYLATEKQIFDTVLTLIPITGEMETRAIFKVNVLSEGKEKTTEEK